MHIHAHTHTYTSARMQISTTLRHPTRASACCVSRADTLICRLVRILVRRAWSFLMHAACRIAERKKKLLLSSLHYCLVQLLYWRLHYQMRRYP